LRLEVINDGRYAALITADELTISMSDPTKMVAYALTNIVDQVCTVALPNCTTATMVAGAAGVGTAYLWGRSPSTRGCRSRAVSVSAALNRARNNPF